MRKALEVVAAAILAALIGLLFIATTANAQRPPVFELNESLADRVFFCLSQKEAIKYAEAESLGMKVPKEVLEKSSCGIMASFYTYLQLVHQAGDWNVYEALWGDKRVFVLTTWTHRRIESKKGGEISPVHRISA